MDKKNAMIIGTIAVLVIFVIAITSAFAYFNLVDEAHSTSKTTITGKAGDSNAPLPTISLKTENGNLYLNLTNDNMKYVNAKKTYYAQTDTSGTPKTVSGSDESSMYIGVSKVDVSGGSTGQTYTCHAKYTITASGSMLEDKTLPTTCTNGSNDYECSKMTKEDGSLKIAPGDTNVTLTAQGGTPSPGTNKELEYSLLDLKNNKSRTFEVVFSNLSTTNKTKNIKALLKVNNLEGNQSYMAGKDLTIKISSTDFYCDINAS